MSYFVSVIIVLVGVGAILGLRGYVRGRAVAAREYMSASEGFFRAVRPLIEDPDTPKEILDVICTLNETIQDRRMAARLVSFPMHRKWSGKSKRLFKVTAEFFEARPELEDSFSSMFMHWFVAVTALAPIAGVAARYSLSNSESIECAAAQTSRRRVHHRKSDDAGGRSNMAHAH